MQYCKKKTLCINVSRFFCIQDEMHWLRTPAKNNTLMRTFASTVDLFADNETAKATYLLENLISPINTSVVRRVREIFLYFF